MVRVLHFVSKMDRAGQETFIMNVMRHIDRKKVGFCFLCSEAGRGDYDDEIMALGGAIYYLPKRNDAGRLSKIRGQIVDLAKWLKDNRDKFDIVHLHTYHNLDVFIHLAACKRAGVENIVIHSHNTCGPHVFVHKVIGMVCRSFYKFKKLACSKVAGEWLFGKRAVRKGEVTVIYNGIDLADFKYSRECAEEIREKLGLTGKIVLGHIGRFSEQKNHEFLMDIFAEYVKAHDDAVLLLIGRGELEDRIRAKAELLGVQSKVRFLGVRDDVKELLQAMDVFVFPSLYEGLSVVLVEVQASSLPVVTNENIAEETIISDGIRLLPIKDVKAWCDCIDDLRKTDRAQIRLTKEKEFDINSVAEKMQQIYAELALAENGDMAKNG